MALADAVSQCQPLNLRFILMLTAIDLGQKRMITSLCRITLLTPNLRPCLGDDALDIRGQERKTTYAQLGLLGLTRNA